MHRHRVLLRKVLIVLLLLLLLLLSLSHARFSPFFIPGDLAICMLISSIRICYDVLFSITAEAFL